MALEQIGYGGLGGLIIAGLSILGIHKRIDSKQAKSVCEAYHKNIDQTVESIKESLKDQKEDMRYIRERLDTLVNGMKRGI